MLESFCIGRSHQQLCITKGSNMSLKRNKQSLITQLKISQSVSLKNPQLPLTNVSTMLLSNRC